MSSDNRGGVGFVEAGTCITRKPDPNRPGKFVQCPNPRVLSTWYCQSCTDDWHAHRDGGRARSTGDGAKEPDYTVHGAGGKTWTFPGVHGSGTVKVASGAGVPLVNRPTCDNGGHTGREKFYTFGDGRVLYGAKGAELNKPENIGHLDLIIDCAGLVKEVPGKFVKTAPNRRFAALNKVGFPDLLRLDWPDMTAPVHVGLEFWKRLLDLLPGHTAVCCMGGHGRTGTALACLLVANGMDPEEAIRTVRSKHCRRAIETAGQEAYIRGLKS